MPDNGTRVDASTESEDTKELILTVQVIILYITFALNTATLIYGVTSWWLLKKFRNYRNYVFLNAILVNVLVFLILFSLMNISKIRLSQNILYVFVMVTIFLATYMATAKLYWLIVMSHMFYVDIVKVFNVHIRRRYLKSGLFGWGVPVLSSLIYISVSICVAYTSSSDSATDVVFYLFILPMILNSLLYIVIVCSLFRSSNASASTATNKWRRLYIATLIFIMSDGLLFSSYVLKSFNASTITENLDFLLNYLINPLILNVYFVVVKRNRELWYKYYVDKLSRPSLSARHRNHNIAMNARVTREPDHSRPAVLP